MIGLEDGMLLYHGSYVSIPDIDLSRCMGGLDFGRGFYLTSSYEQAYNLSLIHISPLLTGIQTRMSTAWIAERTVEMTVLIAFHAVLIRV